MRDSDGIQFTSDSAIISFYSTMLHVMSYVCVIVLQASIDSLQSVLLLSRLSSVCEFLHKLTVGIKVS